MSRTRLLKQLSAIAVVFILVGLAAGLLSARITAGREYERMAQILGSAAGNDPQMEERLMQALKQADPVDFDEGDAILKKYNYSPDTFENDNAFAMAVQSALLMTVPAGLVMMAGYLAVKKKKARIDGLTSYLEAVNLGRDTLLVRQEDDFSHLEDELYKTVTELRQSREAALRERQSLADNLADISHQLKTPITSMSLMTQLLAESHREGDWDGARDEDRAGDRAGDRDEDRVGDENGDRNGDRNEDRSEDSLYIEKLNRQLHRLETLVSSLLTLSRLDAGTLELKSEPVDVFAMLTLAAEPVDDMLGQKGQQLLIPARPAITFTGDRNWTAEAFLNMIKNCSEHIPDGGVISLSYSQNPLYTEIIVEDNGGGFNKEDLPHLFQRFYKGKNSPKDSTGIGLALAKSIIEKQNGTIRAENRPEGGARFVVKLYE